MRFQLHIFLLILVAGAFGTCCRFLVTRLFAGISAGFPFATLIINLTGSFFAGLLYILLKNRIQGFEQYLPILFVGFFGAFTTFSSFALESTQLMLAGAYWKAAGNILIQNVFGILAVLGGIGTGKIFIH